MKTFIQRFKKHIVILSLLGFAGISFSFVDSYFEISKNMEIMNTVLRELNSYYVDEIKPGDLMKKGIDGMLESLDPYTEYYAESEVEDYKVMVTGQYGGIGALVQQKGDYCVISEPYEGFPAQKAGLMAGDVLLEVNGISVKGKNTNDISKLLKGQANTTVKLLIQREGEKNAMEKTLVREEIKIKNVPYSGMINDSVGYIKLTGFTENASEEVKNALVKLKEKNAKSIIFDLRGNGGGLLREAVDIVNLFVERGQVIVTQKGKIKEMNKVYTADKQPVDTQIPLVVLVDRGSASASEIVTGAIQDLDRGVVIGQRSFGKGLVQQTIQLVYNTQMKVTIAKYYTPSGRCIQALDYFHKNPDGTVEKVPDSLMKEFHTRGGRSVYDGSGIFPDVVTDARKYSNISLSLVQKNLIFDYATRYRAQHPTLVPTRQFKLTNEEYNAFTAFAGDKEFDYTTSSEKKLDDFKETAIKEKYFDDVKDQFDALRKKVAHNKADDLQKFRDEITELIEAEIASRYYYQNGRLEASLEKDAEVNEAVKLFRDPVRYNAIVKGEGNYKVIGKPGSSEKKKEDTKAPDPNTPNKPDDKPGDNKDPKKKDKKG
jgi:carboxyl-terminal processing protease